MRNEQLKPGLTPDAQGRKPESRDPRIRWILLVAALVVAMMAACFGIIWLIMAEMEKGHPHDSLARVRGIITAPDQRLLRRFPSPNLQVNPHDDLVAFKQREEKELNSYGWVDRSNGVVRIPIDRAMELIAQRGLPVRKTNAPARTGASSLELIKERSQKR